MSRDLWRAARPLATCGIGLRQPHYAQWLERRPALGFVEVHSENYYGDGGAALSVLQQVRERHDVSLHGVGLSLGSAAGVEPWHLERLARLVERIDPVRVSDHACFARAPRQAGATPIHLNDLLPVGYNPASLAIMASNVQRVQDRLRRPLLVENLSAYLRWADDTLSEVEFLRMLSLRTGCALLLDVNNLVVNALNAQADDAAVDPVAQACAWIDALGPTPVGEIHLAGYDDRGALVIDDHGSRVHAPVWQVYAHALRRLGPVPSLIEWDTGLPALEVLLGEAAQAAGHLSRECGGAERSGADPAPTRVAASGGATT